MEKLNESDFSTSKIWVIKLIKTTKKMKKALEYNFVHEL